MAWFIRKIWHRKEDEKKYRWKDVLLAIYTDATRGRLCTKKKEGRWDEHPLTKKLKISGDELRHSIDFLEKLGFIGKGNLDHVKKAPIWFEIKEKGVNAAIEIQKHRDLVNTQLIMAYFTAILTFTVIFQLFHELNVTLLGAQSFFTDNILFISFIIVIVMILFVFIWLRTARI